MLYPLSYEGGAWLKPSLNPSLQRSLLPSLQLGPSGRPTGTGYWTRARVSRTAATGAAARCICRERGYRPTRWIVTNLAGQISRCPPTSLVRATRVPEREQGTWRYTVA